MKRAKSRNSTTATRRSTKQTNGSSENDEELNNRNQEEEEDDHNGEEKEDDDDEESSKTTNTRRRKKRKPETQTKSSKKSKRQQKVVTNGNNEEEDEEDEDDSSVTANSRPKSTRKRALQEEQEAEPEESSRSKRKKSKNQQPATTTGSNEQIEEYNENDRAFNDLHGLPGHVEHIRLINFMCHDNLEFKFNARVNIINGQNGSGKSAIMRAIMLMFGAKASMASRAKQLKDSIKSGTKCAKIILKICNYNRPKDERLAYRPEAYGKTIRMERTITITGSSSVKVINDTTDKVVGTRIDEIRNICQHFHINIENPVTALTQDISKHFLNSQNPKTLFQFYMRATTLDDIQKDRILFKEFYDKHRENVNRSRDHYKKIDTESEEIFKQKEILDTLKKGYDSIAMLELELKSAQIKKAETNIRKLEKNVENTVECSQQYNDKIQKLHDKKQSIEKEYLDCRDKQSAYYDSLEELQQKYEEMKDESLKENLQNISKECKMLMMSIKKSQEVLEQRKLELKSAEKEKENTYEDEIKKFESLIEETKQEIEQFKEILTNFRTPDEIKEDEAALKQFNDELKELKNEEKSLIRTINEFSNDSSPKSVYPREIEELRRMIEKEKHTFKDQVFGPLGAYVKLQNQEDGYVVEKVLGGCLTSFLVTNSHDYDILSRMVKSVWKNTRAFPPKLVKRPTTQLIDLRGNTARYREYRSIWEMINVEEIEVANYLIDNMEPQMVLYIPDSKQARKYILNQKEFLSNSANCSRTFSSNGDLFLNDPYRFYPCDDKFKKSRYLTKDTAAILQFNKTQLEELQTRIRNVQNKQTELQNKLNIEKNERSRKVKEHQNLKNKLKTLEGKKLEVEKKLLDVQEIDLENIKGQISSIVDRLKEQQQELSEMERKRDLCQQEFANYEKKLRIAKKEYEDFVEKNDFEKHFQKFREKFEQIDKVVSKLKSEITELEAKKSEQEEEIEKEKNICEELKKTISEENNQPIDTERSIKEIDEELKKIKIHMRTNRDILDKEDEIYAEYKAKKKEYKKIQKNLIEVSKIQSEYFRGVQSRKVVYEKIKRITANKVDTYFQEILKNKNMIGGIQIEYSGSDPFETGCEENGQVRITSKPNNAQNGENVRLQYDSKSLSGGERSFSTVALIVSLWNISNAPIRILDEVDVFMDDLTRKICLEVLLHFATEGSCSQFIFLSPIPIPNLEQSQKVTIFNMPKPKRC